MKMGEDFLSPFDLERATRILHRLAKHNIPDWVLTGGMAVELHLSRQGRARTVRPLNDLDFIVPAFENIPTTLADDFLFRHVHPLDPPGKTLLQCIDSETALRIDVFRTTGPVIERSAPMTFVGTVLRVISFEDLYARTARLVVQLAKGIPVAAKHARDFQSLDEVADLNRANEVWEEHRPEDQSRDFHEIRALCLYQISNRSELLISPEYFKDPKEVCARCIPTPGLPLADPQVMLDILGYC